MFETSPAAYYHGDATLASVKPIGNTTVCAIYKWPEWEGDAENWSVLVAPPPRASEDEDIPRAIGLMLAQVKDLKPGSSLPFWLVADTYTPYLPSPLNTANCWPGSGA